MAEGFKIAEGYIELETRINDSANRANAERAGAQAGDVFAEATANHVRKNEGKLGKGLKDAVEPGSDRAGKSGGKRMLSGITSMLAGPMRAVFTDKLTSGLGEGMSSAVKSPAVLGVVVAAAAVIGTALASGIAATLSAALVGGLGLGVIGLGAYLLRNNKDIVAATKKLKSNIVKTFTDAAQPMAKPFAAALGIFNNLVTQLGPSIKQMFSGLAPAIVPLAQGLAGAITAMMPGLLALTDKAGPFLIWLAGKLPGVGAAIGGFFTTIAQNWPAIQAGFSAFMSDTGAVLGVLATAFIWLATHYGQVRSIISSVVSVIGTVVTALSPIVSFLVDMLGPLVVSTFTNIWHVIQGAFDIIIGLFQVFSGIIHGDWSQIWTGIKTILSGAWTVIKALFSQGVALVTTIFGRLLPALLGAAGRLVSGIGSKLGQLPGVAKRAALNLVSWFMSGVSSWGTKAKAKGQAVIQSIRGLFSGSGSWLIGAGRNIISGLIQGISDMIGSLKGKLSGVTGLIPDWKGPAERDAKLLRPNGRLIMGGLMDGVDDMLSPLRAQLGGITAGIPDMAVAGAGAIPAPAATGSSSSIGELHVHLQGVFDPTNPAGMREMIAKLYEALAAYQKTKRR